MRPLVLGALMAVGLAPAVARSVTCTAEVDRSRVATGEQVTLTVTVEGAFQSVSPIQIPSIPGVSITTGGTSQSYTFVNGKTNAAVVSTYYLQVRDESSFTIPVLQIQVDGDVYRTKSIPVEVVRGATGQSPQTAPGLGAAVPPSGAGSGHGSAPRGLPRSQPGGGAAPRDGGSGRPGDEVFITLKTDKTRVYIGEQVVLTFSFCRRVQLWNNPQYQAPRTEGFWREDLPPERNYLQDISGYRYNVTEIRYALFPTQSGRLSIDPAEVTIPADPFDRFFGFARGPTQAVVLRSQPVTLDVLDLPAPQPADFSGIVARDLTLKATVTPDTVPRGEPVSLKIQLVADGFLKSIGHLPLKAPAGVQMHDAVENLDVDKSGPRLISHLNIEKVLVPTRDGPLTLDPVTVSYFNPARVRYETASSGGARLKVTPNDLPVAGDQPSDLLRSEIERLSNDLAFIHVPGNRLRTRVTPLLGTPLGWAALLAPLLLLTLQRWSQLRLQQQRRNPLAMRRRRALNRARRALQAAGRHHDQAAALGLIARAVAGYVADRTGQAETAVSAADVGRYAAELGCADEARRLQAILVDCDAGRFASPPTQRAPASGFPGESPATGRLSREAADLLSVLEKAQQKDGRPVTLEAGVSTRLLLLPILLLLLPLAPANGTATDLPGSEAPARPGPDPARLLAEGNQAYTQGEIDQALAAYQAALAAGVNDPVLHYNFGNACARRGELGKAILGYLRAQRLAPRDRDVRANLAWVRSHTRDLELAAGHLPPVIAPLVGVVHGLSLDEWTLLLIVAVWVVCALVAWGWFRGGISESLRRWLLGAVALLVALTVIVGVRWYEEQVRQQAVVVVPEVEVHSGPATTFPVVFRIHDGLTLSIRGEREGWARIGLGGQWVGWVPNESVARVRRVGPAEGA